ncbi:MAG: hypothetical protein AB8B53_10790, partial [Flavobacteriales bacterium]
MKQLNFLLCLVLLSYSSIGQVVINEFSYETDQVELKNTGSEAINIAAYELCSFPQYNSIAELTGQSGAVMLMPGNLLVVSGHFANVMTPEDDELALYMDGSYSSASSIQDYVEWGSHGHQRSSIAEAAGIWADMDFAMAPMAGMSLAWDGENDDSASWGAGEPTFGSENGAGDCDVNGGIISTEDMTTICSGDGQADIITVSFTDVVGDNSLFVITDQDLNILDTQTETEFDFDVTDAGICLIWHLSYDDNLDLSISNANDLDGCFSLSNSIEITRNNPNGGVIATEDNTAICIGSEQMVNVTFTDVTGTNSLFVVTDEDLNILDTQTETA